MSTYNKWQITRQKRKLAQLITAALGAGIVTSAPFAWAQENTATNNDDVEKIVVISTGTRGSTLTVANSPSPIDIISGDQLRNVGKASLREVLGNVVPSLSAPSQAGGGTSSSVRPVSIRGLSGDHLLVLVNGKRRHNTAVYNNFARIASGSVPVDLDLIPVSAIERIELLRDGASAQYGSDAIAGVLNIILKEQDYGGSVTVTAGRQEDKPGDLFQTSINAGTALGNNDGFLNVSFDVRLQGPSYAAGNAEGYLYYPLLDGVAVPFGTEGATLDPREETADRLIARGYGRSNRDKVYNLAYNAALPLNDNHTLYSFSTYSDRKIKDSRGNFRATNVSSIPEVFPDGFVAQRLIEETDFQVTVGTKGELSGWDYDLSTSYGKDDVWLGAQNTLNASLGPDEAKDRYFLGKQIFDQWTTNINFTKPFDIGWHSPLNVSFGAEYRWEEYQQIAGEPDSYRDGGWSYPEGHPRAGQRPTAGLQSFTGTSDVDAGELDRDIYAAYIDLGADITEKFYASAAFRFESYSDSSGDTGSGKLSARYEFIPGLAVRGTVNTGFRAPSLAQQIFSVTQNTSQRLPDGTTVTFLARYLPPHSEAAQVLGATELKPEKSDNISVGITYEPFRNARVTLDAYQINIDDRIVKSELIRDSGSSTAVQDALAELGINNLASAQYNLNAVDTKTRGIDLVTELSQDLNQYGFVRWSLLYSYNKTEIREIKQNARVTELLGENYVIYGHQAQTDLTKGTPRDKASLGAYWRLGDLTTNLKFTRYGKYVEAGTVASSDRFFSAKWVTDLDVAYQFTDSLTFSVGANNLFGARPDRQTPNAVQSNVPGLSAAHIDTPNNWGIFGPFGLNGAFYYARATYQW